MEYYQYFRLKGPPFQPASRHGAVYFSQTHLEALATLESGLSGELSGLTLLTGEAGTGKTTLIYSLLQRDYKRVRIAHIDDPKLSFLEMMQAILNQMNLYSAGSTKLDYVNTLDHLLELRGKEERIAIVVDESQVLSDDVLEELRLLSNRGQRNDACLMQLILVGQPELAERLKKPQLRQLNQRISSRGVLTPLTTEQGSMYVECRLSAQGGSCAATFEPGALNHLLRRSDGLPRKINMLCHSAMLAAFQATEKKVSVKTAKKIAATYHDSVSITKPHSGRRLLAMPALVMGIGLAALLFLGLVHPNAWSNWFYHSPSSVQQVEPAAHPVKAVVRVKAVEQRGVKGHQEFGGKLKTAPYVAPRPAELPASVATPVVALAETGNDVPVRATSSTVPARIAGIQKRTEVPPTQEQRGSITIRYGDTLESIAIRYFGSKAGINELIQANPQLTNINQLSVGQVIYLPPGIPHKPSQDQTLTALPIPNADSGNR